MEVPTLSISIIHLTDIHFNSLKEKNYIIDRQLQLCEACKSVIACNDEVALVISGDIAYAGKESEYSYAIDLIEILKKSIEDITDNTVEVILVPGNHDCDFDIKQSVRKILLSSLNHNSPTDPDTILAVTEVQNTFYDFSQLYDMGTSRLCNQKIIKFKDEKFLFLLFNTAWMSQLQEKPGNLFFPKEAYPDIKPQDFDCVVSIMHHPYNWFHPDNSVELLQYLRKTTDVLLLGHEHRSDIFKSSGNDWSLSEFHGKELQSTYSKDSAFSIYQFDDAIQNITTFDFTWKDTLYKRTEHTNMYSRNSFIESSIIAPSKDFLKKIEDPGIIINHYKAEDITLSEIFCWPTLEQVNLEEGPYVKKGSKIKTKIPQKMLDADISIITGDSLSGRTSLAKMLFKEYCNFKECCIICDGENLNTYVRSNLVKILDSMFIEQYSETTIDQYKCLDKTKKILIIDNFNNIPYHDTRRSKVLDELTSMFSHIIILSDKNWEINLVCSQMQNQSELEIIFYDMLFLGNVKRKEFVKNWYSLRDEFAVGSDVTEEKVTKACERIDELLGANHGIIPAAPINLINILQNLDSTTQTSFSGSQYGFLYESLILKSLGSVGDKYKEAGDINIHIAVLSALAFEMLKNKNNTFNDEDLQKRADIFSKSKKVSVNYESILKIMQLAKIICKAAPNTYKFRYPYLFYYFAGRYIAYHLKDTDVKKQIEYMCSKLYNESYGNIIIFVCHFANNIEIIDDIMLTALTSLDQYELFDFDKHSEIFERAQVIIEELLVSSDVDSDTNVEKNQEDRLQEKDEIGIQDGSVKDMEELSEEEFKNEKEKDLASISAAIRTIDVLSQIIRNYPGDIEGELKVQIINEIHSLGMRTAEAMLSIIEIYEHDLITHIVEKVKDKENEAQKEEIITKTQEIFSSLIAGMVCGMISKVAISLNNQNLLIAIEDAFNVQSSISQKLIMQELKFNVLRKPNFNEAIALYTEIDDRKLDFASTVLRSIVAYYLRYNRCEYKMRNKICSKLGLSSRSLLIESSKNQNS